MFVKKYDNLINIIMNNIIGHIVGIDEIHKKQLIKQLPKHIKVVDLDNIQQIIYNHKDIVEQKSIWTDITKNILIMKKQNTMLVTNGIKTKNIENEVHILMDKRNCVKQNIHNIWKQKMSDAVYNEINKYDNYHILLVGFNIYPKDYRVKISIPLPLLSVSNENGKYFNKIIYDIKPATYASNQIKYYLKNYADRIIRGVFPLDLLNLEYLTCKYEKFSQFYDRLGYVHVPPNEFLDVVLKLDKQLYEIKKLPSNVFVATIYKSGDTIPVNITTPLQGFLTKEEAINNLREKVNSGTPIYVYEVKAEQFHMLDGKLIATKVLNPIKEESLLLTV
ncbi:hypothetical protein QJ856_gp0904 [Tupanvirus deep ocean]|uniref:Uncharacterized protein n=2 Tax=Tupanvirus TaxID=2094720 RepID=A0AC62A869_9VIRU|nr:hypothetical protein QJ856_gp0904 [Tupanvirus deep ocean]QKU33853.1 hypothetical protein [Tupanvirus deep ocean]